MTPEIENLEERIADLLESEAWTDIAALLSQQHPADIAALINDAPGEVQRKLFSILPEDAKPDVLAELETVAGSEVIESLSNSELSDLVEEMAPDDAADVLSELPEERSRSVLDLMEDEESGEVRKLLEYEPDSAGGIMTPDVLSMQQGQTVNAALDAIAVFDTSEPLYYVYVVDDERTLVGYVNVWELLRERDRNSPLGELVHRDFVAAHVDMDQEEVAHLMNRYDLSAVPVVDDATVLVGRVTADDVIDVMEEEASEDIFRLAGSDDAELGNVSPLKSCFVRLPWLGVTLIGGFVGSVILNRFHGVISNVLVLAAFVPMVLAMAGNTGIQASTLIVRSIAVGDVKRLNLRSILLREIAVGAMMGSVCGTAIGIWARVFISLRGDVLPYSSVQLALVVALALFSAMTFAAVFGASVPILLNRARIDPAVASGPFVTIANDVTALLIYFGVTVALLHQLGP